MCLACQYGKMLRRPWQNKGQVKSNIKMIKQPGQTFSIDQLESKTLGFIAQLKGLQTQKRYQYATIFIDQYSRLSYVHLENAITSEETVQAKKALKDM